MCLENQLQNLDVNDHYNQLIVTFLVHAYMIIIGQCTIRKLEYHIVMMIYDMIHNAQLHLGISLKQTRVGNSRDNDA